MCLMDAYCLPEVPGQGAKKAANCTITFIVNFVCLLFNGEPLA